MVPTVALVALLGFLSTATAAPTDITPRGGISINSAAEPAEILTVGNILVGTRSEQHFDLGANKNCRVDAWGLKSKYDKNKPGWDAYVYCIRWVKEVAWDIRRIGDHATNCDQDNTVESWSVAHSEETTTSVNVEAGGAFQFFSASVGLSTSKTVSDASQHDVTVDCTRTEGVKCRQGAPALVESYIQEGWVTLKDVHGKGKKGETNVPEWWDMEDDANGNGFRASANPTGMHYNYNANYPNGWDFWDATGDSCYANNNKYWPALSIGSK